MSLEIEELGVKQSSHLGLTGLGNCPSINQVMMWKILEMFQEKAKEGHRGPAPGTMAGLEQTFGTS